MMGVAIGHWVASRPNIQQINVCWSTVLPDQSHHIVILHCSPPPPSSRQHHTRSETGRSCQEYASVTVTTEPEPNVNCSATTAEPPWTFVSLLFVPLFPDAKAYHLAKFNVLWLSANRPKGNPKKEH